MRYPRQSCRIIAWSHVNIEGITGFRSRLLGYDVVCSAAYFGVSMHCRLALPLCDLAHRCPFRRCQARQFPAFPIWHAVVHQHGSIATGRLFRNHLAFSVRAQAMKPLGLLLASVAVLLADQAAFARRDAGAKIRGEYNFSGSAAGGAMRSTATRPAITGSMPKALQTKRSRRRRPARPPIPSARTSRRRRSTLPRCVSTRPRATTRKR